MPAFIITIFLLLITPGPGVLSTAGVGSGFGYVAGYRYLVGLFIGTNLVALAVISGLAGIMFSIPSLRTILLILSAAYLFYLATRIALSGSKIAFITATSPPGILNGVVMQIINPKAYTVNTTLFSGFAFSGMNLATEITVKLLIINAIWVPIHLLWLWAGVSLKKLALSDSSQRKINYAMAASLLIVVGLAMISTASLSS